MILDHQPLCRRSGCAARLVVLLVGSRHHPRWFHRDQTVDHPDGSAASGRVAQGSAECLCFASIALQDSLIREATRFLGDGLDCVAEIDLVAELTAALPIMVIADMLSVDPGDRELFKGWSNGIMSTAAGDYDSLQRNYEHIFA